MHAGTAAGSGPDPDRIAVAARRGELALAARRGELPAVLDALGSREPALRIAALAALLTAGSASVEQLTAALHDPDPSVRRSAAELAASVPGVRAAGLEPLLGDPDDAVVEAVAYALGELADPGTVGPLAAVATGHRDPLCRESAVAALGAIGDPAGLPAVLAASSGPPALRRRAVVALAAFEGDEVESALRAALEDRDWQVRQAASTVLGLSGEEQR